MKLWLIQCSTRNRHADHGTTDRCSTFEVIKETIENITTPQALKLLTELEFPTSKLNVAEAKDVLKKLFTESLELRKAIVEAAYGNKKFVRIHISASGS